MDGLFFITRPKYDDATCYLFYWSQEIIDFAKNNGFRVISLDKERVDKKTVINILVKTSPDLVFLNGHGDKDKIIGGKKEEIILDTNEKTNLKIKIIFSRSCRSAKTFGPHSISILGVKAFIGYDEDFTFYYDPEKIFRPLDDKLAELFLKPSNYVAVALMKGYSALESNDKSKNLFKKNIEKLLIEGPSSENYTAISFLYWDMVHQVCMGEGKTTL